MALAQVNAGDKINASDINQFYNILKGVAASGESVTLIYNAAGAVILQPSSDPATGTELIQVKNNAGTVQMALSSDGKVYVAAGTTGAPGFAFEAEKTLGWYRQAAGVVSLSANAEEERHDATTMALIAGSGTTQRQIRFGDAAATFGFLVGQGIDAVAHQFDIYDQTAGANRLSIDVNGAVRVRQVIVPKDASSATAGGAEAIRIGTGASGVLGIYFGSGAPTISAPQGSLYLRTEGASNVTRMYVNTTGSTTWTAVNTVA